MKCIIKITFQYNKSTQKKHILNYYRQCGVCSNKPDIARIYWKIALHSIHRFTFFEFMIPFL